MSLILMHHVPMFVLTTYTDLTFLGMFSAAGVLNICSSMSALINTLAATKCGEGYRGEGAFGQKAELEDDDDTCEMGTVMSGFDETVMSDYDETVTSEYKAMV